MEGKRENWIDSLKGLGVINAIQKFCIKENNDNFVAIYIFSIVLSIVLAYS